MIRRTVQLVERRTRELKLPAGDVAFLLTHARHLVDVVPAFRRGMYRTTPWNRIPRAIAEMLLAHPDLAPGVRIRLRDAALSLDGVSPTPVADADLAAAEAEPRAAHYRPLLAVCRLVHDGFGAARLADG